MSGPPPNPLGVGVDRNPDRRFKTVVRDTARPVPPIPSVIADHIPSSIRGIVNAYYKEAWASMGSEYGPMDVWGLARCAILYAECMELGVEAPGPKMTALAKLEEHFGLTPLSRLKQHVRSSDAPAGPSPLAPVQQMPAAGSARDRARSRAARAR